MDDTFLTAQTLKNSPPLPQWPDPAIDRFMASLGHKPAVPNPDLIPPPSQQHVTNARSAINQALFEPGMELGETLKRTADSQGSPSDYADIVSNLTGLVPAGASKALIAGPLALGADLKKLSLAQKMAKADEALRSGGNLSPIEQGAAKIKSEREIYDNTGWYRGVDGKWRFEIPDRNTLFFRESKPTGEIPLSKNFYHAELFKNYPDMKNMNLQWGDANTLGGNYFGMHHPDENLIQLLVGRSREDTKSTLLHELQHAIQQREGFAPGTNVEHLGELTRKHLIDSGKIPDRSMFPDDKSWHEALDKIESVPFNLYKRHAGEVESRTVQHRFAHPYIDIPPYYGDYPRQEQIIPYEWLRHQPKDVQDYVRSNLDHYK